MNETSGSSRENGQNNSVKQEAKVIKALGPASYFHSKISVFKERNEVQMGQFDEEYKEAAKNIIEKLGEVSEYYEENNRRKILSFLFSLNRYLKRNKFWNEKDIEGTSEKEKQCKKEADLLKFLFVDKDTEKKEKQFDTVENINKQIKKGINELFVDLIGNHEKYQGLYRKFYYKEGDTDPKQVEKIIEYGREMIAILEEFPGTPSVTAILTPIRKRIGILKGQGQDSGDGEGESAIARLKPIRNRIGALKGQGQTLGDGWGESAIARLKPIRNRIGALKGQGQTLGDGEGEPEEVAPGQTSGDGEGEPEPEEVVPGQNPRDEEEEQNPGDDEEGQNPRDDEEEQDPGDDEEEETREEVHAIEEKLESLGERRRKLGEVIAREVIRRNFYIKNERLNNPGFLGKRLKFLKDFFDGGKQNIGFALPLAKEFEDVSYFSRFIKNDEGLSGIWDEGNDKEVFKNIREKRINTYTEELSERPPYIETTLNEIMEATIKDFIEEGGSSPIDFSTLSMNDKVKVVERAVKPSYIVKEGFKEKYIKYNFWKYADTGNSFSINQGGTTKDIIFIDKEVTKDEDILEILNIKERNIKFVFLSEQSPTLKQESLSVEKVLLPVSPLTDEENAFYKDYPKTLQDVYREDVEDVVLAYFQHNYVKDGKYPEIAEDGLRSAVDYVLRVELPDGGEYAYIRNDNVMERIKSYFEYYKKSIFNKDVEKTPFSDELTSFITGKKPTDLNFYNKLTPLRLPPEETERTQVPAQGEGTQRVQNENTEAWNEGNNNNAEAAGGDGLPEESLVEELKDIKTNEGFARGREGKLQDVKEKFEKLKEAFDIEKVEEIYSRKEELKEEIAEFKSLINELIGIDEDIKGLPAFQDILSDAGSISAPESINQWVNSEKWKEIISVIDNLEDGDYADDDDVKYYLKELYETLEDDGIANLDKYERLQQES